MNNLTVCGSSFLVPKNKAWAPLQEKFTINHLHYGDISGSLFLTNPDDILLIVLFLEDILQDPTKNSSVLLERFTSLFQSISHRCENSNKPTIICLGNVFNDDPIKMARKDSDTVQAFNWFKGQIQEIAEKYQSLYFLNLNHIYASKGYEYVFDDRNWYFAHCRLSSLGVSLLANSVNAILTRHHAASSKVLVLDCDNTIWGGVIGEDGIDGILLGQDGVGAAFFDFQKEIKKLVEDGVVLVLASKNNEDEVWNVFDNHPSMVLKKSDIVSWRINWNEKSDSIKSLADELDLGLDSFVFWDDNPVERDKVRSILPGVTTVEMPKDVYMWPRLIRGLENFSKFEITSDDRKKTSQYHGRAKFVRDSANTSNIYDYLKNINLRPTPLSLDDGLLGRAVQLCSKTNQYNFRTIRHTAEDLLKLKSFNDDFCFLVSLSDNYGDHGVVALVCLRKLDESILFIDTFLMSCRVLGRYLEAWILKEITSRAKDNGFDFVIGEFVPTDRNIVAQPFFDTYGFKPVKVGSSFYEKIMNSNLTKGGSVYVFSNQASTIPYLDIYEKN